MSAWRSGCPGCPGCSACRSQARPTRTRRRRRSRSAARSLLGALQTPDVKAVDADQLSGAIDIDVALGAGITRRLIGRRVAGDEPQALGAGVQPVAAEHLPDAVGRDNDPSPLGPTQLR